MSRIRLQTLLALIVALLNAALLLPIPPAAFADGPPTEAENIEIIMESKAEEEIVQEFPDAPLIADEAAAEVVPELDAAGKADLPSFVSSQLEYRTNTTNVVCTSDQIIGIRAYGQNARLSTANLRVEVRKCNGGTFSRNGYFYIQLDGQRRWGPYSYNAGITAFGVSLTPYSLGIDREHSYRIELYSSDTTAPKYTGTVRASAWGRCWCTDCIKQRFGLSGGVPNAKDFGPYLTNRGFRQLNTATETPRAGDVVVMQPSFPGVDPTYGHVGLIEVFNSNWTVRLRQGGSATTGWFDDSFCYNTRLQCLTLRVADDGDEQGFTGLVPQREGHPLGRVVKGGCPTLDEPPALGHFDGEARLGERLDCPCLLIVRAGHG